MSERVGETNSPPTPLKARVKNNGNHVNKSVMIASVPAEDVAILIPCYNHQKEIGKVLDKLAISGLSTSVIVIDDGSNPPLSLVSQGRIIRHNSNSGKSAAIKTGLHFVGNRRAIVFIDADGQHDPGFVKEMCLPILMGEADMVIGVRNFYVDKSIPFLHRLSNILLTNAFNLLNRSNLSDITCGFRAMSRDAFLEDDIVGDGYSIEIDMLVAALQRGLRIHEMATPVFYSEKSGIRRGISVTLALLSHILRRRITS